MLRRGRFDDLVRRQLELFANDEAELLDEATDADDAWTRADAESSEELYGAYQLVVDAIGERLYDVRETYVGTLDESLADAYRGAFDGAARKRLGRYASFFE